MTSCNDIQRDIRLLPRYFSFILIIFVLVTVTGTSAYTQTTKQNRTKVQSQVNRYLYVATPGIRNYLGYSGHGILVFDIDDDHRFVKRIKSYGLNDRGIPLNVKGVAVSVPLNSIYVSTLQSLQRIDLTTEKLIWERKYEGGADRMSISPDGKIMYLPSLEKTFWNVVDCETGDIIAPKIEVVGRAHNTIYGPSGKFVYLGRYFFTAAACC